MTYTVETTSGEILATFEDCDEAILDAKQRLRDDPEMGELSVGEWRTPGLDDADYVRSIGRATHVPDADWQPVVDWLWADESLKAPGPIPAEFRCKDPERDWIQDQRDAYDVSDPKSPDWHSVHADIWDARAGK